MPQLAAPEGSNNDSPAPRSGRFPLLHSPRLWENIGEFSSIPDAYFQSGFQQPIEIAYLACQLSVRRCGSRAAFTIAYQQQSRYFLSSIYERLLHSNNDCILRSSCEHAYTTALRTPADVPSEPDAFLIWSKSAALSNLSSVNSGMLSRVSVWDSRVFSGYIGKRVFTIFLIRSHSSGGHRDACPSLRMTQPPRVIIDIAPELFPPPLLAYVNSFL